jgi:trans-aconitate methyltransferase
MTLDAISLRHAEQLSGLLRGYFVSQAIYVAARLSIADLLARADGLVSVEELAAATGSHPEALYRMLRALAGEGIFQEHPNRYFGLTPVGEMLRSDVPGSMRPAALLAGETQYKVWALFKDGIKHGTPGFDRIFRQPLFPFLDEHPDIHALFNDAMTQQVVRSTGALLAACEVSSGETVVDVGGGLGCMVRAVLKKYPQALGVLFDSEKVIAEARETVGGEEVLPRLTLVAGDFFKSVPRGDVMILGSIVHMFLDAEALRILKNCRASLAPKGRIYLVEKIVTAPNASDAAKWYDLNMLLMTGGRERTFEEFAGLLRDAGFGDISQAGEGIVVARAS